MNLKVRGRLVHLWTSWVCVLVGACLATMASFAAEPTISITATPRYPWNGLVDLAFTIEGDEGAKYDTSFSARDVVGGTNLAMKTVYKAPGVKANVALEKLESGTYNWLWDAPVDLTSLRPMYSGCVPASSTVLFKNSRLDEIDEFHAVPCGTSVSDKFNPKFVSWTLGRRGFRRVTTPSRPASVQKTVFA